MKNWGTKLEEKIRMLPDSPGCYLMKDRDGTIIYVGPIKCKAVLCYISACGECCTRANCIETASREPDGYTFHSIRNMVRMASTILVLGRGCRQMGMADGALFDFLANGSGGYMGCEPSLPLANSRQSAGGELRSGDTNICGHRNALLPPSGIVATHPMEYAMGFHASYLV